MIYLLQTSIMEIYIIFDLTENRSSLVLNGNLADKVADNKKEYKDIIFARRIWWNNRFRNWS